MGNVDSAVFPFTTHNEVTAYKQYNSHWEMFEAVDNHTQEKVSVFSFDKARHEPLISYARNHIQILRTLKHPRILRFIATTETMTHLYLVTERVYPLVFPFSLENLSKFFDPSYRKYIPSGSKPSKISIAGLSNSPTSAEEEKWTTRTSPVGLDVSLMPQLSDDSQDSLQLMIGLGLFQLAQGLRFLNEKVGLVHANIQPSSIFHSSDGDWRISGFELAFHSSTFREFKEARNNSKSGSTSSETEMGELPMGPVPPTTRGGSTLIQNTTYTPPEWRGARWKEIESSSPLYSCDVFSYTKLATEIYLTLKKSSNANSSAAVSSSILGSAVGTLTAEGIPTSVATMLTQGMVVHSPTRPSWSTILSSRLFLSHVCTTMQALEDIPLSTTEEKAIFFKSLLALLPSLPWYLLRHRLLALLLQTLPFGTTGGMPFPPLIASVAYIASTVLAPSQTSARVVPVVLRCLDSTERIVRLHLLLHLPALGPYFSPEQLSGSAYCLSRIISTTTDSSSVSSQAYSLYTSSMSSLSSLTSAVAEAAGVSAVTSSNPSTTAVGSNSSSLETSSNTEYKGVVTALLSGLADSHPTLREATVKCLGALAPCPGLTPAAVTQLIVPALLRAQNDSVDAVRSAVFSSVSLLASRLPPSTSSSFSTREQGATQDVLLTLFVKALADDSPKSREMALRVTRTEGALQSYRSHVLAKDVIPTVSIMLLDSVPAVRKEAAQFLVDAVEVMKKRMEKAGQVEGGDTRSPLRNHTIATRLAPQSQSQPLQHQGQTHAQHQQAKPNQQSGNRNSDESSDVLGSLGSWAASAVTAALVSSLAAQAKPQIHTQNQNHSQIKSHQQQTQNVSGYGSSTSIHANAISPHLTSNSTQQQNQSNDIDFGHTVYSSLTSGSTITSSSSSIAGATTIRPSSNATSTARYNTGIEEMTTALQQHSPPSQTLTQSRDKTQQTATKHTPQSRAAEEDWTLDYGFEAVRNVPQSRSSSILAAVPKSGISGMSTGSSVKNGKQSSLGPVKNQDNWDFIFSEEHTSGGGATNAGIQTNTAQEVDVFANIVSSPPQTKSSENDWNDFF